MKWKIWVKGSFRSRFNVRMTVVVEVIGFFMVGFIIDRVFGFFLVLVFVLKKVKCGLLLF